MKFLSPYHNRTSDNFIEVSAKQGSDFAKQIANDYNPIHDPESKRFCVPGDLLFSLALAEYGLYKTMQFQFLDLVAGSSLLRYPALMDQAAGTVKASKQNGKEVLSIEYGGGDTTHEPSIEQFLRAYVAFSGHNFPHILVPLMKQHNSMINPKRPMVIYQSMSFELSSLEFESLSITGENTSMKVDGRRGDVQLGFALSDGEKVIGRGSKNLMLGGLREYDDEVMDEVCRDYFSKIPEDAPQPIAI